MTGAFFPAIFLTGAFFLALAGTKIPDRLHSTRNTRRIYGGIKHILCNAQSHESARKSTEILKTGSFLYVFKKS